MESMARRMTLAMPARRGLGTDGNDLETAKMESSRCYGGGTERTLGRLRVRLFTRLSGLAPRRFLPRLWLKRNAWMVRVHALRRIGRCAVALCILWRYGVTTRPAADRSGNRRDPPTTERNIRYQFSLRSLLLATLALALAFGLFRLTLSSDLPLVVKTLAGLSGLLLCGGVSGAAVGHAFQMRDGSMAKRGAIVGAIAFRDPGVSVRYGLVLFRLGVLERF